VFDEAFIVEPNHSDAGKRDKWGGYQIEFKLIERSKYLALKSQP
jgi:hypothetical protein